MSNYFSNQSGPVAPKHFKIPTDDPAPMAPAVVAQTNGNSQLAAAQANTVIIRANPSGTLAGSSTAGVRVGIPSISNAEFLAAVFTQSPEGAFAAVCSKSGDPTSGGWMATRADLAIGKLSTKNNNYFNCSSFYPGDDGSFKAQKGQFAACHLLMLDDIGTKVSLERIGEFKLSALIETSKGNHQGVIIFAEPITDGDIATRLLNALIDAGLCDAGASGPLTRWARLPVAINGKPKHADDTFVLNS